MLRKEVIKVLKDVENADKLLEVPPDPEMGDYALPCFELAKAYKKSPQDIAQDLAEQIEARPPIRKIQANGPYLNFYMDDAAKAKVVLEAARKGELWTKEKGKKILLEYPSPNTNKPLHLGHVRNMCLGSAISTLLQKAGNKVIQVNLNNDRGIHICKSMLAYKKWGGDEPDKKPDHFVGDYYVKFSQNETPELLQEAQEMLQKWEGGDKEVRKLWKKMNDWARQGFKETYDRYGIKFDKTYNESEIYTEGKDIVLKNRNKFEEDEEGALVASLEEKGLPDKVVLRSDGTSIYVTQDIALTLRKNKDFKPDLQIWVVANEQELYFRQLFEILDLLEIGDKEKYHHLSYGMIALPDGRMKSREGRIVDADDLLDEMEELAAEEIQKRHDDWSDEKTSEIKKDIAMAAIRFYILKYDPAKDFTFDPETSLSFEGDTGPYIQYTHARICSILKKGGKPKADHTKYKAKEEQDLIREIGNMKKSFERASREYRPSTLANQLLTVCHSFNTFYHACPVIDSETEGARLYLIETVRDVIQQGLQLLGINAPEEM